MLVVAYTNKESTAVLALVLAVGCSGFAISGCSVHPSKAAKHRGTHSPFRIQREPSRHCSSLCCHSHGFLEWNRNTCRPYLPHRHGEVHRERPPRMGQGVLFYIASYIVGQTPKTVIYPLEIFDCCTQDRPLRYEFWRNFCFATPSKSCYFCCFVLFHFCNRTHE